MGRVFLIRADGNSMIGMGHLMRCLTVASSLRGKLAKEERILFVCADEHSALAVRGRGFEAVSLNSDYKDLEGEIESLSKFFAEQDAQGDNTYVILADSYYLTDRYCSYLKEKGTLFLLDDLQEHAFPADGVINYNVFADGESYRTLYEGSKTVLYLGGSYVPVREEFRKVSYEVGDMVRNVLITTGGGDTPDVAGNLLRTLLPSAAEDVLFHVVAGRFNPNLPGLTKLAGEYPQVVLHFDVQDMAGLMRDCDLAITAGGTTVYELAAIGVPFICLSYAPNQEKLTEYIGENTIAGYAGAYHKDAEGTLNRAKELFLALLDDASLRRQYSEKERALIDGMGAERLAAVLHETSIKKKSYRMVYNIIAAVVFGIAVLAGFLLLHTNPVKTYDIAVFGDSLLGEVRDETGVCELLSDALDMQVLNAALGGTGISRTDKLHRLSANRDGLSMAELVRSVVAGDFAPQRCIHVKEGGTEYFDEAIADMAEADFRSVDLFLLEYGLNDFHAGSPLDDSEDPYNEYTYAGAVRSVAKNLHRAFPDARIVFITPTYAWYLSRELNCEEYNTGYGNLGDYVDALIGAAQDADAEVIDLYHDFYPHETFEDHTLYTRDGMHPNEVGRALIAERIAEYFRENP